MVLWSNFLWQAEQSWPLEKDGYPNLDESDQDIKQEMKVNVTKTF